MDLRQEQSDKLLISIKNNLSEIESLYDVFNTFEVDYVYRFYHQSYKVFGALNQIEMAVLLFEKIAPDGLSLNQWFRGIAADALAKTFDWNETNSKWLAETRPILEAFWHSHYFLEQMRQYGAELDKSPTLLPEGWAALLYLYDLR